ncbi:MAG TPA: MaoC family dehydratase N-terminal domain-containing protein [Gammaproteobacteria bacterium]|nr:MaoC family dehydratase N-terminal domain-containing protein [Gammaproteobacteria bacterium]
MSTAERPEEFVNAQHFHQQPVGLRWRTQRRTVTEYDLLAFVTNSGFNEALFLDAETARELGFEGRLIPGAMSFALAEGLVISSGALSGVGLAFLGCNLEIKAPVYVGDTIEVWVEVTAARMTSRGDRGVVTTRNEVRNQRGELVLVYTPSRMIRA